MIKTSEQLQKTMRGLWVYIWCMWAIVLFLLLFAAMTKSIMLLSLGILSAFLCLMAFIEYSREIIRLEMRGGKDEL